MRSGVSPVWERTIVETGEEGRLKCERDCLGGYEMLGAECVAYSWREVNATRQTLIDNYRIYGDAFYTLKNCKYKRSWLIW